MYDCFIQISAIIGFVLSLATFFITRYEKRKRLEIELFCASINDFPDFNGYSVP